MLRRKKISERVRVISFSVVFRGERFDFLIYGDVTMWLAVLFVYASTVFKVYGNK